MSRQSIVIAVAVIVLAASAFGFPDAQAEKARLEPRGFPKRTVLDPPARPLSVTAKPEIQKVLAAVSGDSLWRYISQLSGEEPAVIGGAPHTLLTRYALSTDIDLAATYLWERFEDCGLSVEFQGCLRGRYDFNSGDFVDSNYGWVVGTSQRVYKTSDGGLTWVRQRTGAISATFWDVWFVNTLKGWVVGSGASVQHAPHGRWGNFLGEPDSKPALGCLETPQQCCGYQTRYQVRGTGSHLRAL